MNERFPKIVEGLHELFPDSADMEFTEETELGDIPEWDSMSSVNFQSFLQQTFEIEVPQDLLAEETTIGEVMAYLDNPESAEA